MKESGPKSGRPRTTPKYTGKGVTIALRIPDELHKIIQYKADEDMRSFNNYLTVFLSKHFLS